MTLGKILAWPFHIFTEPDGNGGKASFARVFGAYVIVNIVIMARADKSIPEALVNLFMYLVGYQLLSKAINSPAVIEYLRLKASLKSPPAPDTIQPPRQPGG